MIDKSAKPFWNDGETAPHGIRRWTPRDKDFARRQIKLAGRYSRFVDFMKLFLPLSAVGILVSAIILLAVNKEPDGISIVFRNLPSLEDDLHMVSPVFTGFDTKNRPYKVTAERAVQDVANPNLVMLQRINGNLLVKTEGRDQTSQAEWIQLTAARGLLNSVDQNLQLSGDITLIAQGKYEFLTEQALVDFRQNIILGDVEVQGTSPMGNVVADSFEVRDDGNRIFFSGHVRTIIIPDKKAGP